MSTSNPHKFSKVGFKVPQPTLKKISVGARSCVPVDAIDDESVVWRDADGRDHVCTGLAESVARCLPHLFAPRATSDESRSAGGAAIRVSEKLAEL